MRLLVAFKNSEGASHKFYTEKLSKLKDTDTVLYSIGDMHVSTMSYKDMREMTKYMERGLEYTRTHVGKPLY